MGTNSAPDIANLTLYGIESRFVDTLSKPMAQNYALTGRFIDDVITWGVRPPSCEIYGLNWLETTNPNGSVNFLGANITPRINGSFLTSVFDKFQQWNFPVIKYPHADSNVPNHQSCGIVKGQLYRFRTICNTITAFKVATTSMVSHMLLRGHCAKDILKGWNSHLVQFHSDRFTNYLRFRMWFKKMCFWAELSLNAGCLGTRSININTTSVLPSMASGSMIATTEAPRNDLLHPRILATNFEIDFLREQNEMRTDPSELVSNTIDMETVNFMTDICNDILPDSQGASQAYSQTSTVYQLLTIFAHFFAADDDLVEVNAVLKSMACRWNAAKRRGVVLNRECPACGQMYNDAAAIDRHQSISNSNCEKVQRLKILAITAIQNQNRIQHNIPLLVDSPIEDIDGQTMEDAGRSISYANTERNRAAVEQQQLSPSGIILRIGNIQISERDMATLINDGQLVEDNIIDAFQILSQQIDPESYYFPLSFFQLLMTVDGYQFNNVCTFTGDAQLYTKKYLYIPMAFGGHYILIVVDIEGKTLRCYDPLGTNRKQLMGFILLYMHDVFHMEERGTLDDPFDNLSWSMMNIFSFETRIQFNSVDCGVFLMKFVQCLQQLVDVGTVSQVNMVTYRRELRTLLQNS
jgi:hypothetical protein